MDDGGEGYKGEWTPSKHLNIDYFRTPGEKYRILPQRSEEEFDLESLQRLGACAPVCKYPEESGRARNKGGRNPTKYLGSRVLKFNPNSSSPATRCYHQIQSNGRHWNSPKTLHRSLPYQLQIFLQAQNLKSCLCPVSLTLSVYWGTACKKWGCRLA